MKNTIRVLCGVFALATVLVQAPEASADDVFLQVPSIPGESTAADHAAWIDVLAWSWGAERIGGPRSSPTFGDFVITKSLDRASPELFEALASGMNLSTVRVEVVRSTAAGRVVVNSIALSGVTLRSHAIGQSDGVPVEEVSFGYEGVEWSYWPLNPDGSRGAEVRVTWTIDEGT